MKSGNVGAIQLDRSEPYLDGQHLDALIQLWLDDCADRLDGLGPNGYIGTTAGYAEKIAYFRLWWGEPSPSTGSGYDSDCGSGYGLSCDWRLTQRGLLGRYERYLEDRLTDLIQEMIILSFQPPIFFSGFC